MILAIRDDVEQRRILSAATPTEEDLTQENPNTSASTSANDWGHANDWGETNLSYDDWLMADTPSTAPSTAPKAKGKSKGAKRTVISGGYTAA